MSSSGDTEMSRAACDVRNVVLVGHSGAGKTTLAESLLVAAGVLPRAGSVTAGTTASDYDECEQRQQRSVNLSVLPLSRGGVKVNLLDTPGYADFVGDLRAGLRAADAALFVVSGLEGVDGTTRMLWDECAAVGMPRAIVVTKLDHPRADFGATVAACQEAFGAGVLPLHLPRGGGLVDLLTGDGVAGGQADARAALIEGIIAESEDESLLERYLGGEDLDAKMLLDDLETAVSRASFFPVLGAAAGGLLGTGELLSLFAGAFPSPREHPLPAVTRPDGSAAPALTSDPAGPLVAEVVKTTTDPYVGRVSLVRVFSGTLRPDLPVHVSGHGRQAAGHPDHDVDERVGSLATALGATMTPVEVCAAGDICAVTKLTAAETGDTLSDRDTPLLVTAWSMPEPLLPVAIQARSKSDEDKLSTSLARLVAEDPTLTLEQSTDTGQLVLWCMGESHVDVVVERMRTRYGVEIDRVEPRVALRETLTRAAGGLGRHVKQSGGHGQFAICRLEVEPLPTGSGLEFVDQVVGGAVPRQFIPSVEKGVRAQMARGVRAGYPMVDLRVRLVDGKAHSVDSSDMAFQLAGGLALREAAKAGGVTMLEPVLAVTVLVPDEHVGTILSDLAGRRGRVVGTEPVAGGAGGRTVVRAETPATELLRYAVDLRSLTQGTGTFSRSYLRHEPMPAALAAKIDAAAGG
jgi:elongation factor G